MPALSSTMKEGKIVSWIKSEGDVVVVESDKADMDVDTFYDDILASIVVPEGETAPSAPPSASSPKPKPNSKKPSQEENRFGTYYPGMNPPPPPEYITCLGDLYSVAWMEDSERHNLKKATIKQQYETVKEQTSNANNYNTGSHVVQYGSKNITEEKLYLYLGFDPASVNFPPNNGQLEQHMEVINQRDAEIYFMWQLGVRTVFFLHVTFSINSICHIWGKQVWNTGDLSKNNWLLGLLAHGDGWHNNHHAFDYSARQGLEWWQIDLTWYITIFLEAIGLATDVKLPTDAQKKRKAFSNGNMNNIDLFRCRIIYKSKLGLGM